MDVRAALLFAMLFTVACDAKGSRDTSPSLKEVSAQIDAGQKDRAERLLLDLNQSSPGDAQVMALLARINYLRAVGGRAHYEGMPPMDWDRNLMSSAEDWARRATETDPLHANGWVVYAQIRHAQFRSKEALEMLDRAESLDPTSKKLRLRKGTVLRTIGHDKSDMSLLKRALDEYRKVIEGEIDTGEERLAASEIAEIQGVLGEYASGVDYIAQALVTAQGSERATLFDRRAKLHVHAGHADAAIADSRTALDQMDFGVGRTTLTLGLLLKAGLAMRDAGAAEAAPFLSEAMQTGVSIGSQLEFLSSKPTTFPALYAVLGPDLNKQGGREAVAKVVGGSAAFITADDLQRLQSMGVNFNHADPHYGTLLQRAIAADNVEAVRTLLGMDVDTRIPHPNGSSLLEATLVGTSPARTEIRRLVLTKVGEPRGWKEPAVDMPKKGQWYRTTRTIGLNDHGQPALKANQIVLIGGWCFFRDRTDVCLTAYSAPDRYLATVSIPLAQLDDLNAFEEVDAPDTSGLTRPSD
jgi:tetratricopeptide (TPR) repeat protein